MKLINLFLIIMIVFADIAICSIDVLQSELEKSNSDHDQYSMEYSSSDHHVPGADHRFALFQQRKQTRRLTCKSLPRICRAKGSPGPTCCKKKCVNIKTDRHNCGKCGKKCKYDKICCNGKCVNPSFNKKHCGGCNNRCSNGGLCAFGLCSYS